MRLENKENYYPLRQIRFESFGELFAGRWLAKGGAVRAIGGLVRLTK